MKIYLLKFQYLNVTYFILRIECNVDFKLLSILITSTSGNCYDVNLIHVVIRHILWLLNCIRLQSDIECATHSCFFVKWNSLYSILGFNLNSKNFNDLNGPQQPSTFLSKYLYAAYIIFHSLSVIKKFYFKSYLCFQSCSRYRNIFIHRIHFSSLVLT